MRIEMNPRVVEAFTRLHAEFVRAVPLLAAEQARQVGQLLRESSPEGATKCKRCGKAIRRDEWGHWVDRWLYRTCGGDIPHEPVSAP